MSTTCCGLNGSDSLGFMATMGLVRILRQPLRWTQIGTLWTPEFHGVERNEALELLHAYFAGRKQLPPYSLEQLKYGDNAKHTNSQFQKLRSTALKNDDWETLSFIAAYGEILNDELKTTEFSFTHSGGREILITERKLLDKIPDITFDKIIDGPWELTDPKCGQNWSPREYSVHGNRFRNPDSELKLTNWAANLLAFESLPFFPVYFKKRRVLTTGFTVEKKDKKERAEKRFHWCLWKKFLSPDTAKSIVSIPNLSELTPEEMDKMGITARFSTKVVSLGKGFCFV